MRIEYNHLVERSTNAVKQWSKEEHTTWAVYDVERTKEYEKNNLQETLKKIGLTSSIWLKDTAQNVKARKHILQWLNPKE